MLGASSLRRKLKRMPDDVTSEVKEAISDSADLVYFEALRRVPVDQGNLAGALARKISSDRLGAKVGYWKIGNLRNWRRAGWRAHFTEFGTKGYKAGTKRLRANTKTTSLVKQNVPPRAAQPFLGPAFNASKRWVKVNINRAIDKALRKVIRG